MDPAKKLKPYNIGQETLDDIQKNLPDKLKAVFEAYDGEQPWLDIVLVIRKDGTWYAANAKDRVVPYPSPPKYVFSVKVVPPSHNLASDAEALAHVFMFTIKD